MDWLKAVCSPLLAGLLVSDYGLVTMGPKLFVWAVPTILLYAILLALYKQSGLADRINTALHPIVRPIGLNGRDILRVVMGFGCNVPAVINTRTCSRCTRGNNGFGNCIWLSMFIPIASNVGDFCRRRICKLGLA